MSPMNSPIAAIPAPPDRRHVADAIDPDAADRQHGHSRSALTIAEKPSRPSSGCPSGFDALAQTVPAMK